MAFTHHPMQGELQRRPNLHTITVNHRHRCGSYAIHVPQDAARCVSTNLASGENPRVCSQTRLESVSWTAASKMWILLATVA